MEYGIRGSIRVEKGPLCFYLETEMPSSGRQESMATGNLTDAILNMLGRSMNQGLPSGSIASVGPGGTQGRDYTAELIARGLVSHPPIKYIVSNI